MIYYCAHEFGGSQFNKCEAKRKIKSLQMKDHINVYVAPTQTFGFLYDKLSYDEGMRLCFALLERCDALLIMSGPSKGVVMELHHARNIGMPVNYLDGCMDLFVGIDPLL